VKLQYKTFWHQSVGSVVAFVPSLCWCLYLVNSDKDWNYDSNVILNNQEFNVGVGIIIATGLLSCFLAHKPNWFQALV
jgi:hypothetical protein